MISFGSAGAFPVDFEGTNVAIRAKVAKANPAFASDGTTATLGGAATFTGASLNPYLTSVGAMSAGAGSAGVEIRGLLQYWAFADQAGNVIPQGAYAGVTYRDLPAIAIVASTAKVGQVDLRGVTAVRCKYTNGGVAQGTFEFSTFYGPGN